MNADPYDILELGPDAPIEAVRRSFRRLALSVHPDLNPTDPDAEGRFRMVVEAYRILSDPLSRAELDRKHPSARTTYGSPEGPGDPSLFQEAGRRWATDGQDVVAVAHLDMVTSITGGNVDVRVLGPVACGLCDGSGFDPNGTAVTCWTCGGSGQVAYTNRFGESTGICLTCGGEKVQPAEKCAACIQGTVIDERVVPVRIPEGTGDGDTVTVAGAGGPGGRGGKPGDLLVVVMIDPHPVYTRDGLDLRIVVPIGFDEACLGADITVPTFDGGITLTVPPGTQGGTVFAARGRGVKSEVATGDLLVTVHIAVPVDSTEADQDLLARLPDAGAGRLRAALFDMMSKNPSA